MTGGIIEITIPYELWDNTSTKPIQLPKGTYKAFIENASKVLYIHVVGTSRENILNSLEAIRVIDNDSDGNYILIEFKNIANEFAIEPDDTINFYKASSGETWLLNEGLHLQATKATINFTSNNQNFTSIVITDTKLKYNNITVFNQFVADGSNWVSGEAYRTITFEEAVTDSALLAWLEANGVKQA